MTQSTAVAARSVDRSEDVARRRMRLAFLLLTGAVVVASALTLFTMSVPGSYFLVLMVLPVVWLAVGGFWIVMADIVARRVGWRRVLRDGMLLGTAVIVLATALAVVVDIPLRVRLAASQPAIDALSAEFAAPGAPMTLPDRWIGLFDAERIERFEGGYRFLVKWTGFLDPGGFAYSPDGTPPNLGGEDWYGRLDAEWWIWIESW
jgi:hypothetical protein